jgi:DNA-binding NarL/FixJ family response regulator
MRAGLRALLERLTGYEVVAEARDGLEALILIEQHRPQLVLMDIAMPNLNGLEAAARVAHRFSEVRILMLSMHSSEDYVRRALQAGAQGYLLKDASPTEFRLALETVARGEVYLSPAASSHVVAAYVNGVRCEGSSLTSLTPRQREVLQLLAEGHRTKAIAQRLQISARTVESYRAQLMRQLGIHDVPGLVRYAVRMGLVSAET